MSIEVRWNLPTDLNTTLYDKTRVYRCTTEQGEYELAQEINTVESGSAVYRWVDPTGSRSNYYYVKYFATSTSEESPNFLVAYFPLTPREVRMYQLISGWFPDIFKGDISEVEFGYCLRMSLNMFNVHPPMTNFDFDSFPANYEQMLLWGCIVTICMMKYLKLSIRDFSYSDMGFSLNIDRGAKIKQAMEDINKLYLQTISMDKWAFLKPGLGIGTIQMPWSFGGQMPRGMMNMLDVFTSLGK